MTQHITVNAVNRYLRNLAEQEKAAATIEKYRRDAMSFVGYLAGRRLSRELVQEYKSGLCKKYAPQSVNSMLAAVNGLLEFLGRGDLRVRQLRIQRQLFCKQERELKRSEYERLVKTARAKGNRRLDLILQTLCSTGMRIGELQFLTVQAVRRGRVVIDHKGKIRTVMLPKRLCAQLIGYCKYRKIRDGVVFRTRCGRPVNRSNVWSEMKRLCSEAGVSCDKVFPHNLRHLFARTFYNLEKDISRLADVLGHSSINTTRLYILSSGGEHERQLEKMRLIL